MTEERDIGWTMDLGATMEGPASVRFRVWAPYATTVAVRLPDSPAGEVPLEPENRGYFSATVSGIGAGARYRYVLNDKTERPDPASRWQPDGVHEPSAVVDPSAFRWTDTEWRGLALEDLILYELHTGTFTEGRTFESIIPRLPYLKNEVGVTALELMPVAQFPGSRNWGYDGVYPFAPHADYGGPQGLKALVDACHAHGLAVVLDVVYNHLGPEGNYLNDFGPYFTDRYRTPWGRALNFDGPDSDEVRRYFVCNALYWVTEYHLDGLRLDAVHGIYDFSATHILAELAEAVHAQARRIGRTVHVIAESDLNDARLIRSPDQGGYGLDAQWSDDFHHALHTTVTDERGGYYQDFSGLPHLAAAMQNGFVYRGQYAPARRRRHGNSCEGLPAKRLVVFAQNHDQIGNRALGDRLSAHLPVDALKVVMAAVLLSANVPLLFMGEEYGEQAPFQYFIEHGDPALVEAVRRGRREEFSHFGWKEADIPDPQDRAAFEQSRLRWGDRVAPSRAGLLRWTRALIDARAREALGGPFADGLGWPRVHAFEDERVLVLQPASRERTSRQLLIVLSFNPAPVRLQLTDPAGGWLLQLDAASPEFGSAAESGLPKQFHSGPQAPPLVIPPYAAGLFAASS